MLTFRIAICSAIVAAAGLCQQPEKFEVASIKPNAENDNRAMMRVQPGGRFVASGINTKMLIGQAYDVREFQISGGPGWITSDRFDINAKAEGLPERMRPGALRPYIRSLLEERFQLKTHMETKEMPAYALVVGKNGPKLTPAAETEGPGPMVRMGRGQLDGKRVTLAFLAQELSRQLGRAVVDKTGLQGSYDVVLNWTPEPGQGMPFGPPPSGEAMAAVDSSGPTIFTALQEQLGLKLESQKAPTQILVIDSISKPTEN